MDKLEKLKENMLAARANRQKFMDDHKRPMTEEERKEQKSPFRSFDGDALGEQVSGPETYLIELKSHEDAMEMQRLEKEMHATYKVFVDEWQRTKDNGIDHE